MTIKSTTSDDLDDFAPEDVRPQVEKRSQPVWNGRRTRIRLAHPVLRGTVDAPAGRFLDNMSKCADCGMEGHAFHANASRADGRWVGPEADSIATLQQKGYLAGTKEARKRDEEDRRRRDLIGPSASPVLTAADLEHLWKYELKDGHVNGEIESGLRRDEAEQLRRAVKSGMTDLADSIREALIERAASK